MKKVQKKIDSWSRRKKIIVASLLLLFTLYIAVILWHTYKPLPKGISYEGELHETDHIELITDLTFAQDKKGTGRQHENHIFKEVYGLIEEAEEFVVVDFFLMDGYYDEKEDFPPIADTMSSKLANKKRENPDMPVIFITDPLNKGYGSYETKWFKKMREAGVEIVYTDLKKLRDSTPAYSGIYRIFLQWFDHEGEGWISNAMSSKAPKMNLSSYLELLNVKANHRKAAVSEKEAIITSSNPHDGSGFHGNLALKVQGSVINDILESEEAVSIMSGGPKLPRATQPKESGGQYKVQYLTERKILDALLSDIAATKKGDKIWLGMFFIAERKIVDALTDAANRGVEIKMILDPNENSFGREKTGLPNRPVVNELLEDADQNYLAIRWYNTVVGQYHTKAIWIQTEEQTIISSGSANYTERTLYNYNLENNLRIMAPNKSDLVVSMENYFERLWENEDAMYTLDAEEFQDTLSWWQRWIYTLQQTLKVTTY
ncbi:phospholipase [Lysinibacillus yapensis]|uniref:phospholipase D n=1 Tax=Ureibacillus yapensis TaxID=2304605 RepID=A0A396S7C1_9BACL|nr:phospholipase D family protein [Lysinibacillus yapensis]RHW36748.1 phospholipase [Lysinibacillus yapensis]